MLELVPDAPPPPSRGTGVGLGLRGTAVGSGDGPNLRRHRNVRGNTARRTLCLGPTVRHYRQRHHQREGYPKNGCPRPHSPAPYMNLAHPRGLSYQVCQIGRDIPPPARAPLKTFNHRPADSVDCEITTLPKIFWAQDMNDLDLLEFPEDFVQRRNKGGLFDLQAGEIKVGIGLMDTGGLLRASTVRAGGQDGEDVDVGSVSRARFLKSLSQCHRTGRVRLPGDDVRDSALSSFKQYRSESHD